MVDVLLSKVEVRPPLSDSPPGQWWTRREDVRLLTGAATFVGDVDRDDQLFLRVVRSSAAHGHITDVRVAEAARLPGVVRVLTAADLKMVPRVPLRLPLPQELESFLQPVLATHRVRYVGEPVAIVVTVSQVIAEDAAELVVVEFAPLPAAVSVDEPHVAPVETPSPTGSE